MPLEKHHKIMIGSFSTLVFIFMVAISILLYFSHVQQQQNYMNLNSKIMELQADTNAKFNEITTNILNLDQKFETVSTEVGSINEEFDLLKASAGEDFSGIIEQAIQSVVTVRTDSGQGTGFIIHEDGYIVTNAHVLATSQGYLADNIKAITYEQGTKSAEFIGYDSELDLALLKISGNYEKLKLGNSDNLQVGQKVIAIGNPLGLQFSVSEGIISAVHRSGMGNLEAYIQIDAALNPGNSGGPLIDKQGDVIGINNFKLNDGESLGFALESNYIEDTINDISQEALNQTLI